MPNVVRNKFFILVVIFRFAILKGAENLIFINLKRGKNMEFEKIQTIEKIGKNREKLLELEKTGNYVFHGSPSTLDFLSPHQAEGENMKTGEMEKDGSPAICASDLAEQAIFRALIHEKCSSKDSRTGFGTDEADDLHFWTTQNLIDIAKNSTGKVYVIEKNQFNKFKGHEWRSNQPIIPEVVIEVTFDDLPKDIKIIE